LRLVYKKSALREQPFSQKAKISLKNWVNWRVMNTDYFGERYNPDKPIIVNSEFMVARIK